MKLNCALLQRSDAAIEKTVVLPRDATVADLAHALQPHFTGTLKAPPIVLHLLKQRSHTQRVVWLSRVKLPLLDVSFLKEHGLQLDDSAQLLQCDELFGSDFHSVANEVHVVAIIDNADKDAAAEDEPPLKRARTRDPVRRSFTHLGVIYNEYCVPLDEIDAFSAIQAALTLHQKNPVLLLEGPSFSGKTTIAQRVDRWITASMEDKGRCLGTIHPAKLLHSDAAMWHLLGGLIHVDSNCTDKASYLRALAALPTMWFLVLDNFHLLTARPSLASQFVEALREMRELPNFGGFLGVGLGDSSLKSLPRDNSDLFPVDAVVDVKPFSSDQMRSLFKQFELRFRPTRSLQEGLMAYSGGCPGVLGSLVSLTLSTEQYLLEFDEWREWFETVGFGAYVQAYPTMFRSLTDEWYALTQRKWHELVAALKKRQGASDPVQLNLNLPDGRENERSSQQRKPGATSSDKSDALQDDGYECMRQRIRRLLMEIIADCRRRASPVRARVENGNRLLILTLLGKNSEGKSSRRISPMATP